MGVVMMQETKQAVRDASLTMQDAWKLIARRKKLPPQLRDKLMVKLRVGKHFIDEALEQLESGYGD
jgi:hypothetical protein